MQLPRRGAPVERTLGGDRCVPPQLDKAVEELGRPPLDLDRPMRRAIGLRAMDDARLPIDPLLFPQAMVALVHEEDAAGWRQQALHDAPERLEAAQADMGEEEAEEHDVRVVRGVECECIGDSVDDAALSYLRAVAVEHLGRRVGHDQPCGMLGEDAGPLAGSGGDLEDAAAGREVPQRLANGMAVGGERIAVRRAGRVVLGGPRAVVGDLLVEQLPVGVVHQRRSAGTPSVTAAAMVAVARARACPALRAASPAKSWVAALGMAARMTGTRVQPMTSTVGAVAPGSRSMRVATAVSTARKAASSRMRVRAGWPRAPEASTRVTTPS